MGGSEFPDFDDDDDARSVVEPGDGLPLALVAVLVIGVIAIVAVVDLIASALQ